MEKVKRIILKKDITSKNVTIPENIQTIKKLS
jgi:hypothetical protein